MNDELWTRTANALYFREVWQILIFKRELDSVIKKKKKTSSRYSAKRTWDAPSLDRRFKDFLYKVSFKGNFHSYLF